MIEDDDDRALFFDPDVFGETATVTIGEADPFPVAVIFDTRPPFSASNYHGFRGTADFGQGDASVAGAGPRITARTSDVAGVKSGRAFIALRDKNYLAYRVTPDGTGFTLIELKEAD